MRIVTQLSKQMDGLVDFLWPLTITIGVLMAIVVIAFLAFLFLVVYGLFFSGRWLDIGSRS